MPVQHASAGWRWREHRPAGAFLLLLGAYHMTLIGRGALAWPDEFLYQDPHWALDHLRRLDIEGFARSLTGFGARPAEALLRLPAAALQQVVEQTLGVSRYSPASLWIPAGMNVVTSLLLGVACYRLALDLLERQLALLATVVFCLLAWNNVWVRHILPYDMALVLCLWSLREALAVRTTEAPARLRPCILGGLLIASSLAVYPFVFYRQRAAGLAAAVLMLAATGVALRWAMRDAGGADVRKSVRAGVVAGVGLAVYPAYYSFHAAVGAIVALGGASTGIFSLTRARLRSAFLFGTALFLVLAGFEVVARVGNVSYLASAYRLSKNIHQGNPEEGFVYLMKYCAEIEGAIGVVLLALFGGYLALLAHGVLRRVPLTESQAALARCALIFFACHLVYAFQSAVLHRLTFSGRYLRMYSPILVLAAIAPLARIQAPRRKLAAQALLLATACLSFVSFAREYARVDYPADVLYRLGIGFEDVREENRVYESNIYPDYTLPVKAVTQGAAYVTHSDDDRFLLVNFGWFQLEGRPFVAHVPEATAQLLFEGTHFLCSRSARFEGFGSERRRQFRDAACKLKVYRLRPDE